MDSFVKASVIFFAYCLSLWQLEICVYWIVEILLGKIQIDSDSLVPKSYIPKALRPEQNAII